MFSSSLLHRIKSIKIRHAHMVTCVDKENMKHLQKTCTPAMDTLTLHGKYIHVFKFFITMVDYDSVLHLTLFTFDPFVSKYFLCSRSYEMLLYLYIQGFFYSCPNSCLEMSVYYISINVKIMYCFVANIHEWLENVVLICAKV